MQYFLHLNHLTLSKNWSIFFLIFFIDADKQSKILYADYLEI